MADYGVRITLAGSSPFSAYTVDPWSLGILRASAGAAQTGWTTGQLIDVSPVGEQVDIAQGGNYASVSEFSATLSAAWFPAFEASGASLFGASIEIGSLAGSVLTSRWIGVVSDVSWQGAELRISAESITTLRHRSIPARVLTAQEFPGISSDADGKVVPIIYGSVEGLTPPSIKSTQYMAAAYRVSEIGKYDSELASVSCISAALNAFTAPYMIATGSAQSLPALYFYTSVDETFGVESWYTIAFDREVFYIEVTSGMGSGQTRKVTGSIATVSILHANSCTTYCATCGISAPWDTIPDTTSTFRFYTIPVAEVLIVGDECTVSRTYAIEAGEEFNITAAQGTVSGVVTSDVSGEFRNGENYSAVSYVAPDQNYGSPKLTDRKSANVPANKNTINILPCNFGSIGMVYPCDAFCRTKMFCSEFPKGTEEQTEIDCLFSFESAPISVKDVKMILTGEYLDGTEVVIKDAQFSATTKNGTSFSNYSPSICSDAAFGDYSAYSIRVGLPRPVSAFASFRACLLLPDGWGAFDQYVYGVIGNTGEYAAGSTTIRVMDSGVYTFAIGDKIRPYMAYSAAQFSKDTLSAIFRISNGSKYVAYAGPYSEWRTVQSVTPITVGGFDMFDIGIDSPFSVATGTYATTAVHSSAPFKTISEIEAGFAFVYGEVTPDAEFRVDVLSGRTSSSVPITLARDAARDIFLRDLSVPLASTTAYASLPADQISMALVEAEDSAAIIARMCEEFNWVAGHDGAGAEVATAWLARVGTASADYAVANADIVGGSISGVDATSLDDVATLPSLSWGWTQADGFSNRGNVTDCSGSPDDLTPENYLQTLTGFGDYATSLDAYTLLYEAWQRSGIKRSLAVEYRYGGTPESLYIPARMAWAASRKSILQFRVNDTHAAAAAYVGQRISVSHKRYATNTVYGTLVATYWYPAQGQVQLTVMLDPFALVIDDELYIDTIDASGATEQYIDQRDGTTEQYIEVIA